MRSDMLSLRAAANFHLRLNPTLIWICALTTGDKRARLGKFGLNPTLIWICALTEELIDDGFDSSVLILL